jgi:hypothetical protein
MTYRMPPPVLPPIEDHLTRVVDEADKAARYLAAAMAFRFVPRFNERVEESPTGLAFVFMRQGVHMAFLSTLAALVEVTKKDPPRVNLPRLLRRLDDARESRTIATHRRTDSAEMHGQVAALQARFDKRIKPLIVRAKDLRDNVVAHHGVITDYPESTYGVLTRLMIRVVVLVDAVSELMTGVKTNVRMNMVDVRYQAAQLWSKGMDGDTAIADPFFEEEE